MIAKVVCITFLILGAFLSQYYPGVQAANGDSTSSVNADNSADAVNYDTTDVGVNNGNDGKDQDSQYRGCGYYYPCYRD